VYFFILDKSRTLVSRAQFWTEGADETTAPVVKGFFEEVVEVEAFL